MEYTSNKERNEKGFSFGSRPDVIVETNFFFIDEIGFSCV